MQNKVILVLVDGMRPDGIEQCGNPYLMELKQKSTSCFSTQTIMPSYTLPCHASLFLSVGAERHGITTNNWMPQVR
ncbi:MAG: alkaline phosphatase family protein, partial [Oscillospiraceae bacterium]